MPAILILTLVSWLSWPVSAGALSLDCVARLACVSTMGACQSAEVAYRLETGSKAGGKVVVTTAENERFYEFRRLPDADGVILQASGGALEPGQGAGALTVFDDLGFVLTRHSHLHLDGESRPGRAVAISILGSCEESK
jgi:hypothetical protein